VIPSYNYGHYLSDVLNGLNQQTYQNIEIIILDDCSSDDTEDIVENWKKQNSYIFENFTFIKLPRRVPPEWVLNIGFIVSRGAYIVIHDADDISHQDKIEKQLIWLKNHPETAVVGTKYQDFIENKERIIGNSVWVCTDRSEIVRIYQQTPYHCVCFGTLMFRVEVLNKILACKKVTDGFGDYEFISRIVSCNYVIDNIDEYLFYVRKHSEQSSKGNFNKKISEKDFNYLSNYNECNERNSLVLTVNGSTSCTIENLLRISNDSHSELEVIIVCDNSYVDICEQINGWYQNYKDLHPLGSIKELLYLRIPRKISYPGLYIIGLNLVKGEDIILYIDSKEDPKHLVDISKNYAKKAGINHSIKVYEHK